MSASEEKPWPYDYFSHKRLFFYNIMYQLNQFEILILS